MRFHHATALVLLSATLAFGPWRAPAKTRGIVDLQLVMAVDASASVDKSEFRLQMMGIATAFREAEIQAAIAAGPNGAIAVALVVWAASAYPKDIVPWRVIRTPGEALAFADFVENYPRRVSGGTGIGAGMAHAVRHIMNSGYVSRRRIVDVSGDGRETRPQDYVVLTPQAQSMALALGITVNGLAILSDDARLDQYYREHVAIGAESFVMTAASYQDVARAMARKLLREIEHRPKLSLNRPPGSVTVTE